MAEPMVKQPGEVEVTQYLRPNGRKKLVFADVGEECAKKAEGMRISSEVLTTGEVAIYVRFANEIEESESVGLAVNGPGENSPANVLKRMIDERIRARLSHEDPPGTRYEFKRRNEP
jgi:hypothetical protein